MLAATLPVFIEGVEGGGVLHCDIMCIVWLNDKHICSNMGKEVLIVSL